LLNIQNDEEWNYGSKPKITGDNPFYLSYRDWRLDDHDLSPTESEQLVVVRWFIKRHPCLGIEVVPIEDSILELDVVNTNEESDAPGQTSSLRRVPQKLKITLSCNECDCGKQEVTIKYHGSVRRGPISGYGLFETTLSIICVGPECGEEEVVIRQASYDPPEHVYDISLPDNSREI